MSVLPFQCLTIVGTPSLLITASSFIFLTFRVPLCVSDHPVSLPNIVKAPWFRLGAGEAPLFSSFQEKRCGSHGDRYVWEEDPCQEHGASLIFRQVLFWWVHKQFTGSLEVVHFTRLFKDLWHLRRAGEANNPTFRMWVFPPRSILDRNIK